MHKVEGTILVQGLIEGPCGAGPEIPNKLKEFVDHSAKQGLQFSPQFDGDRFSLLAEEHPQPAILFGPNPQDKIENLLQNLVDIVGKSGRIYSSIRSSEFQPGQEIQTVYAILPDGSVGSEERVVSADTLAPQPPMPKKKILMSAAIAILAAAVALWITSRFVDFTPIINGIWGTFQPAISENLEIKFGGLDTYLKVKDLKVDAMSRTVIFTVEKTTAFPADMRATEEKYQSSNSLLERLTLETLVKGYMRCEVFDTSNHFISAHETRIQGLWNVPSVKLNFPIAKGHRLGRVHCDVM